MVAPLVRTNRRNSSHTWPGGDGPLRTEYTEPDVHAPQLEILRRRYLDMGTNRRITYETLIGANYVSFMLVVLYT